MSLPTVENLIHPVLMAIADGERHKMDDIYESVANQLGVSAQDRQETYKTKDGRQGQNIFNHRVRWARQFLVSAGLAVRPLPLKRGKHKNKSMFGYLQITEHGLELFSFELPIDLELLRWYSPMFRAWETQNGKSKKRKEKEKNLNNFLRNQGVSMSICHDEDIACDDEWQSNMYAVTVRCGRKWFSYLFAQDPKKTEKGKEPTNYDVLSVPLIKGEHLNPTTQRRFKKGINRILGVSLPGLLKTLA